MGSCSGAYFLDLSDPAGLQTYLRRSGAIGDSETVRSVEKAGEGNMNCTARVLTNERSFIVKQSRPWVEKYPQIAAPEDRALVEARFYELVATRPDVAAGMPAILSVDAEARLLCIEDLGASQDFTSMYSGRRIADDELQSLVRFVSALHAAFRGHPRARELENREMRELNHQYIFVLPLESLQPDPPYAAEIKSLGDEYLANGECLLHGDYFPGSWLRTAHGVKVIDPEFGFFGPPEFDLGVMVAHLHLARSGDLAPRVLDLYGPAAVRTKRVQQFAGVEIMRRLVGVAKLPVSFTEEEQRDVLARARGMVME
jgi:5-methylthioribose kinase